MNEKSREQVAIFHGGATGAAAIRIRSAGLNNPKIQKGLGALVFIEDYKNDRADFSAVNGLQYQKQGRPIRRRLQNRKTASVLAVSLISLSQS